MEAVYERRIMGEVPTYRECQKGRVNFRECREEMAAGSMASNMMTQHRQVEEAQRSWITPTTGDGPRTYRMALLSKGGPWSFPVEGCPGRVATRTAMRVHFLCRNVLDTVVILEEGNSPHTR